MMYNTKLVHKLKLIVGLSRFYSAMKKSHYDVLHLKRNCSEKEIKNAFITLSKELHPDKNKDPNAQKQFVAVLEAYNVLSKPSTRASYDKLMDYSSYRPVNVYANTSTAYRHEESSSRFRQQQQQQYHHFYNDHAFNWRQNMRTAETSNPYYGVNGLKKMPNYVIIILCFAVTFIGTVFQVFVIRELYVIHKRQALERSKHLSQELEKVRAAALTNTNDVQTQLILEKIVNAANPSAATATLGQSLVTDQKEDLERDLLSEFLTTHVLGFDNIGESPDEWPAYSDDASFYDSYDATIQHVMKAFNKVFRYISLFDD